jgi:MFS family permease
MGLLPSYHYWGITATLLLVFLRMLQGLTVGGEMPGAMVYLLETAKPNHRALMSSCSLAGAMLGVLLAVVVANMVTSYFSQTMVQQFAWRLPFIIGVILAIIGAYLRTKLWQDDITNAVKLPVLILCCNHWRELTIAFLFLIMAGLFTGIVSIYFVPYMTHYYHYALHSATQLELALTALTIVSILIGAVIVDYFNCYRKWLLIGTIVLAVVSYPLFLIMDQYPSTVAWMFALFIVIASMVFSAEIVFFAGIFKNHVRYSGVGLAHGLAMSLVGGTSPLLLNYGVLHFGRAVPGLFFACTAVLSFFAVLVAKKNYIKK